MKHLIMQTSPSSCYFLPLRSKYSPRHPVLKHLKSVFLFQGDRPSVTTGKITVMYILIFGFLHSRRKGQIS